MNLIKISIVVPNYNGARYLAECLDSVVSQLYKNLELIFVDGGSTDASLRIACGYGSAISTLISEPDQGQSDAINKGIVHSTGEIVAYLNSDDTLEPGSLEYISRFFSDRRDAEWLAGSCRVYGDGTEQWILRPEGWSSLVDTVLPWRRAQKYVFPQSGACFMRRSLIDRLGLLDVNLHYSMDMEYYARAAFLGAQMHIVEDVLAEWRIHPEAKSWTRGCAYAFRKDELAILERYLDRLSANERDLAEAAIRIESPNAMLREAGYWTREKRRLRGLGILFGLAAQSPSWMLRRPWLGGVRQALFGYRVQ